MPRSEQDCLRDVIRNWFSANRALGIGGTFARFKATGISRRTVQRIVKRVDNNVSLKRKSGTGRKAIKLNQNQRRTLRRDLDLNVGQSYVELGAKVGVSDKTVKRIIGELGYKRRRRKNAPKTSEKQVKVIRKRLNKARRTSLRAKNDLEVVMDDESYYPFIPNYADHYYSDVFLFNGAQMWANVDIGRLSNI